jgi:hypothetical protein
MKKESFLIGKICSPFIALALIIYFSVASAEAKSKIDESKAAVIKAAYLRYVADFSVWPAQSFEDKESPITICIMGKDPYRVGKILQKVTIRKKLLAQGRPLVISKLTYIPPPKGGVKNPDKTGDYLLFKRNLQNCNILFLTRSEKDRLDNLHQIINNFPVMLVSEINGFSSAGGMIEFVIAARKESLGNKGIDLYINLEAVQKARLRISSKLLRIKKGVKIVKYPKEKVLK